MSNLRSFLEAQARKPVGLPLSHPNRSQNGPARKRRETKTERKAKLEDWKRAVASFVDRLERWLREADEDHA